MECLVSTSGGLLKFYGSVEIIGWFSDAWSVPSIVFSLRRGYVVVVSR